MQWGSLLFKRKRVGKPSSEDRLTVSVCSSELDILRLTVVRKWITGGPVVREEQRRHSGRPDYWMRQRRVRRSLIIIWPSVTRHCRSVAALQLCRVAALQPNYR